VTRPVVYDNLGSREGAFLACVQRARDSHERRLLENIDPDSHPRDQLVAGSRAFFGMLQEHPGRWKLLFGGDAGLPADATQQIMALRFATIEQIRLVLVAAAPNSDPERLEAAAHVAYGAAEGLGFWWLSRPEVTLDAVVEHCTEVLWRGLAPYTEE
ncbi:TetR/AcrR family transcriptional regulator, partial [Nocardioides sp.]|uniref:TetR/AcrR family transcriptional regulator n=1 Tax=Nocardioides sp. TaxID=35761 RepID=UPI0035624484